LPLISLFLFVGGLICFYHSHAAIALGRHLFPLFALALDLDEHFFDDKVGGDRYASIPFS